MFYITIELETAEDVRTFSKELEKRKFRHSIMNGDTGRRTSFRKRQDEKELARAGCDV